MAEKQAGDSVFVSGMPLHLCGWNGEYKWDNCGECYFKPSFIWLFIFHMFSTSLKKTRSGNWQFSSANGCVRENDTLFGKWECNDVTFTVSRHRKWFIMTPNMLLWSAIASAVTFHLIIANLPKLSLGVIAAALLH